MRWNNNGLITDIVGWESFYRIQETNHLPPKTKYFKPVFIMCSISNSVHFMSYM